MRTMVFVLFLMLAGIVLFACPVESNAISTLTEPINLRMASEDIEDTVHGYSWNPGAETLTLADGFNLDLSNYSGEGDCAIRLNPREESPVAVIELEGTATITTKAQYSGIWSSRNLKIKSADGKKGYLNILVTGASTNTSGIRTGNGTSAAGNVTVSDNTILNVNGGDYCLAYNASGSANSQLSVTGSSAVKLSGSSKAAGNRFEMKSADRVMFYNGSDAVYKKENESGNINSKNTFVIMDFSIPDGQKESNTKYIRTYDGKEHKVVLNENRSVLNGLGIDDIKISRQKIDYRESQYSDYFTDSDYRDKEITDASIAAADFYADSFAPKDAAVYNMSYKGSNFVSFTINPRKIKVTGLAAKDKTYDGWSDAEIDYSGMNLECVNFNSGETKNQVIMECDTDKYGSYIVPCVKADFMDGDAKSADVAYTGTGISAKVVSKNVKIEEITLSDPNYEVTQPGADGSATQTSATAKIFPRSLNDGKITADMTNNTTQWGKESGKDEWSVAWNKNGFRENDFNITLKDSSAKTAGGKGTDSTLIKGSPTGGDNYDYLVNPNSSLISDIGTYDIKVAAKAGNGNYTDTRILKWKIRKALTGVTINKTPAKIYETGEPHTAEPGSNENGLYYTVKDTEYNINITDGRASGDITVRYKGRGATSYTESETAPSAAGDYTVTVSYKGSGTYEASSNSFDYTISPLRIDLSELAIGTYDKHESKNAIWAAAAGNSGKDPVLYNGSFRSPSIWVADSEGNVSKLAENTDYTASGDTSQVENNRVTTDPGADEKPYRITVTGVDKYIGSCVVPWNIKRLPSSISAVPGNTKWNKNSSDPWNVVYEPAADYSGTDYYNPKFRFEYENEDYKRLNIDIGTKVKYCYTNTDSGTVMYDTMPTDAGSYKVEVTLPATDHYEKSSCEVSYKILPRPVVLSRVNKAEYDKNKNKAETSKVYDGTVNAVLNLSDSRWKDDNGTEMTELTDILSKADYSDPAKSPVKYTAAYAEKDVKRGMAIDVTLSGLAFDSVNAPAKTGNYSIKSSGNLDKIKGVIKPYSIGIKEVSAADKVYDGSADAAVTVTLEDIKLAAGAKEEKVVPAVSAVFVKTGSEKAGKDVNKKDGKIYAKNVSITYNGLNSGNSDTIANNYDLVVRDEDKTTQAVINPKSVEFKGLTAEERAYDGSKTAKLDWSDITLDGILAGDESNVVPDKNTYAEQAEYDDPDVKFDDDGYVIAKDGKVFVAGLDFAGSSNAQNPAWNYTADKTVKFSGVIRPKTLTGAIWTFDENNYKKVPTASYPAGSLAEGDKCDTVVACFTKNDADRGNYSNPVKDGEFADDTVYVARITDLSNSNYGLSDSDAGRNYEFYYDRDPDQVDVEVTEFGPVTYGTAVPAIQFTHSNTYIAKLADKGSSLITYTYSGSSNDGKSYYSSGTIDKVKAPVNAGHYTVTVEIPATYHFMAGSGSADFEIEPKPLAGGLEWTFDDQGVQEVPAASFKKNAQGRIEGLVNDKDKCEPVVEFFETSDINYRNPLSKSSLKNAVTYRAKATGTDNPNYTLSEEDATRFYNFKYIDVTVTPADPNAPSVLTIINYTGSGSDSMYTVTYGTPLASPQLAIVNTDILGMSKAEQADCFTFKYEGEELNGKKYSADTAPTQAGTYKLTVTQAATAHYPQEEASASFRIVPAAITITDGVKAKDKYYNGTAVAALDFSEAVFKGAAAGDDLGAVLESDGKDSITYSAVFADKNVKAAGGNGEGGADAAAMQDVSIDPASYSFIYNEKTPDLLYNYKIEKQGNQDKAEARILPRPVTVRGIKVRDKVYDGSAKAVIDQSGISFANIIEGDKLKAAITGEYQISGTEYSAKDVLADESGNASDKNVKLDIELAAADDETIKDNYCVASEGQQWTAAAKILPAALQSVVWNFDSESQIPEASATEAGGKVEGDTVKGGLVVRFYSKSDSGFKKPLKQQELIPDNDYAARVESTPDTNYIVSEDLKTKTYIFRYGLNSNTRRMAEETVELALNTRLSLGWSGRKLSVKWGDQEKVDGFFVYIAKGNGKFKKAANITANTSYRTRKNIEKRSRSKSIYKAYVKAYISVNGKKVVIGESKKLSIGGSKAKYSNEKKVVTASSAVKLSAGEKKSAGAYVIARRYNGKKTKKVKLKGTSSGLRYWSTNTGIATVSSNGVIRGESEGRCTIYVMARNGLKKKIKVTVE